MSLPSTAFREVTWREGTEQNLRSRFAAIRVRPAHRDYWKAEPHAEEWLLIEWPRGETEPAKYWISTLPANTGLKALVKMAKHRWIVERDYQELKQELGLGHFEGTQLARLSASRHVVHRGLWVPGGRAEPFFPSARAGHLGFAAPEPASDSARAGRRVRFERHNPHSIATLRTAIARKLLAELPQCPFCGSSSASISGLTMQEAGREWFGAVCQPSSSNFIPLSFSSTTQRQLAGEPAG